jgi:hypothetical protein
MIGADAVRPCGNAAAASARQRRAGCSAGSRGLVSVRPSSSASAISAWPIDTSSTPGTARRKSVRLSRFRSWPALISRPTASAACGRRRVALPARPRLLRRAMRSRIGLGVELHPLGAGGAAAAIWSGSRVHEQADAHAQRPRTRRSAAAGGRRRRGRSPAVVAGGLLDAVGHEGDLMRPQRPHQAHQVVEGVAFEVVLGLRPAACSSACQVVHVLRADVSLIGPRVHGDALGAGLQAGLGATASARSGMPSARVLRSSATLLTLTESAQRPSCARGAIKGFT